MKVLAAPLALAEPAEAFRPLPTSHKLRLVLEILGTYVRVRWSLLRTDFRTTLDRINRPSAATSSPERAAFVNGLRLGRAVSRTLVLLPTDSRCLVRSLVLTELLVRRGIDSTLVIGVRPHPGFEAHAWVECCGAPVLPDQEYERLVELGGQTDLS